MPETFYYIRNKIFVLDTKFFLHEPIGVFDFHQHSVVIPMAVLEELDDIKDRKKSVAAEVRTAIRLIDEVLGGSKPEDVARGGKNTCRTQWQFPGSRGHAFYSLVTNG
ncbi:PIN domain-containing protein [Litorivicinus sp.]|nr:PIN domain-containing protein [Litorivicinus sp.]MDC1466070.1 PIN domain-containing protein [Litorivicinus sp.]